MNIDLPLQGPTEFSILSSMHGPNLEISKDRLCVNYSGDARHANDVGSIQANRPVPLNQRVYYFEITVSATGDAPRIGIGFTDTSTKLTRQPGYVGQHQPLQQTPWSSKEYSNRTSPPVSTAFAFHISATSVTCNTIPFWLCRWDPGSFGWLADTGTIHQSSEKGESYGSKFGDGDTVGAGIHLQKQEIFFTYVLRSGSHGEQLQLGMFRAADSGWDLGIASAAVWASVLVLP